jgi:hypothetical protein
MAIKLVISNKVTFKVEGFINDEAGKKQPFNFKLTCDRLSVEDLQAIDQEEFMRDKNAVPDFMVNVAKGWADVTDEDGNPEPFSTGALRKLFQIPGVAGIAFATYMSECGAKAKN